MDERTKIAAQIAGNVMIGGSLTKFLIDKVESSSNATDEAAKKDIEALDQEAARQKIEMELALQRKRPVNTPFFPA